MKKGKDWKTIDEFKEQFRICSECGKVYLPSIHSVRCTTSDICTTCTINMLSSPDAKPSDIKNIIGKEMKNEKEVRNVKARDCDGYHCIPLEQFVGSPESITAYGYDYIREDKCIKWEKMGEINGVDIEYCKCPPEEEKELKIGDTVVLKSGGPVMTVIDIYDNGKAYCAWFMDNNDTDSIAVPISCLEEVEKEHIGCDGCELDCDNVDCDMSKVEPIIEHKSTIPFDFYINAVSEAHQDDKYDSIRDAAKNAFYKGAMYVYNNLIK